MLLLFKNNFFFVREEKVTSNIAVAFGFKMIIGLTLLKCGFFIKSALVSMQKLSLFNGFNLIQKRKHRSYNQN